MDNVIIKYSDWFDNDGGFDKIRSEFKALGDDLIKEAKRIKDGVNIFDLSNADGLREYEEQAEKLSKVFKELSDAKKNVTKIETEYNKKQKASIKQSELQSKNLADLEEKLAEYRLSLKTVNTEEKLGVKTGRESAEIRADLKIKIKAVTQEINKQQKEILESNKLSKKEEKLLKANLVLQKDRAETIEEIRERLSALRLVASQVNITTQEGRDAVAEYNTEIDELTDTLEENSDKFIKNKINVGNYEESIINALNSTGLFSTQIGVLDNALNGILRVLTLSKEEIEAMEKAMDGNAGALKRFAIAFGRLNKVLKASIIGVVVIAIAALGSAFGNTRAGAIKTQKALQSFQASLVIFGNVASEIIKSIGSFFSDLFEGFKKLSDISIKDIFTGKVSITDLFGDDPEEETESLFERIKKIVKNGGSAIIDGFENIDRAFRLEDKVRRLTQELERLNGELAITESIADDSTKSLLTQLDANRRALLLTDEIGQKRREIARAELEAINERVKQNIKLNNDELKNIDISKKGQAFAKATLNLAERRGSELKISNELIQEQQEALVNLQTVENDLQLTRVENFKQRRELQRDLFEQNLDLLIDFIDTEKNLSEQQVNDVNKNFQDRIIEFNRFITKFQDNAQKELNEFNKLAKNSAEIIEEELSKIKPTTDFDKERIARLKQELLDLKNIDLQINFDETGDFEVLNNGVKLSLKDIVELNKELQKLGIAEIPINRFREFNVETTNAVKDFRATNKELKNTNYLVNELTANLKVDKQEIEKLKEVSEKIAELSKIDQTGFNRKETDRITKELERLERERTEIIEKAEAERLNNRLKAIDEELAATHKKKIDGQIVDAKIVEDGSQRQLELLRERAALEKQIIETSLDANTNATKDKTKTAKEQWEKFKKELDEILDEIFNKVLENNQKQLEAAENRVDKQNEAVESQRTRAENGLSNTLAFEQRELAKREAELLKRQKRQQQIEELQSFWNTYNANLKSLKEGEDSSKALVKTLRDIAIVKSITASLASFGDGGVVEDKLPANGIFRGQSHNGSRKGIPILVEGQEGIFSANEMANIGKDNFYKMKHLASLGPVDTNFFSEQQRSFSSSLNTVAVIDPKLVTEIRGVKEAIKSQPSQLLNVPEVVDGVLTFTETITKQNLIKRNHYKIKKPRL